MTRAPEGTEERVSRVYIVYTHTTVLVLHTLCFYNKKKVMVGHVCRPTFARAASPEAGSGWPMLDLVDPISKGSRFD